MLMFNTFKICSEKIKIYAIIVVKYYYICLNFLFIRRNFTGLVKNKHNIDYEIRNI